MNYAGAFRTFAKFLKHDDATRVTPPDVVAFKDHRLTVPSARTGKPVSPRTVHDNDLAALKSVFGWAVDNHKLPSNPAAGVRVKGAAKAKSRGRNGQQGFTAEEAKAILSACLRQTQRPNEAVESYALRRWVPWVMAYTGARVGEIVQLRKQDVVRKEDHWVIHITPEAGTVKTDEARDIPVHPHLVELGFVEFVNNAPGERLFVASGAAGRKRRPPEPVVKTTARGKRVLTPPARWRPTPVARAASPAR